MGAVFGPMPHMRSIGSGARNAATSGPTTVRPSGLLTSLAIFAANLDDATPAEHVRPVASNDVLRMRARDRLAVAEERAAAGDVEERLVDREAFDERRVAVEDVEDLRAHLVVAAARRRHDDRLRAAAERLGHRHRRAAAEHARLVRRRGDDAAPRRAADEHGLAAQRGIVVLLDGREEGVHVDVEDFSQLRLRRSSTSVRDKELQPFTGSGRGFSRARASIRYGTCSDGRGPDASRTTKARGAHAPRGRRRRARCRSS